ncbi:MAG: NAD(P)-dependent oxidoreductase [Bdellovibrionales bacterium]|nr:NAD(P)-dependent oxidoreductase [Bdellovibrionales bacterium]
MKVLVTGANGFLGSWLTRRLCQDGHKVTVLIRGSSDISEIEDLPIAKNLEILLTLNPCMPHFEGKR